MKPLKLFVIVVLAAAVTGCFENRRNTDQLCKDNPKLRCERMNQNDGQCKLPRTKLIWHRYDSFRNPSDVMLIKEYALTAEYKKCIELASQIQTIDQADLRRKRFNALVNAGEDLEALVEEIRKSSSPDALYFLWSQTGDESARRSFLQLEGKPALETAEMQYALATFYTSRDLEKTVKLLNKSLELSDGDNLNTDIFKSLASINYQINQKEQAYVWAMVASAFEVPVIASTQEMKLLYGFSEDKYEQLDNIADDIKSALDSGKYKRSMMPKFN
ncbi:DUF2989 domain-containing protein [Vibrio sp. Of14-4]|uniref:DUF2989 domain-containing protein n=1 Tax=Vibrio sp. Of14-4 TaxID=2724878 RepID=UPI001EF38A95|nr:DUF2989 domain-containing protein [Vibrio sp. Of14-4]MCG7487937.1 DUF2989 domain-containing protein [Vibrio sp. Of14-4]